MAVEIRFPPREFDWAIQALRRASADLRAEADKLVGETAQLAAERARQLAPVRTGRLRRGIGWKHDRGKLRAEVGVDREVFYAPMVEFGHRLVRGRRKAEKRVVGHVEPRPFLRPALEEAAEVLKARLLSVLQRL